MSTHLSSKGSAHSPARFLPRLARIEGLPIILVFVILVGFFMIASPQVFLGWPIYLSFLTTVPPMLVLAIGLTLVVAAGEIDLSFPSTLAFPASFSLFARHRSATPGSAFWRLWPAAL